MHHPRVLAYHLILTAYGFWLPNDPRGSWSDFVRAWELQRFGPATKTDERRSVARNPHDVRNRREAKEHLARDPVQFTGLQARTVAHGFRKYATKSDVVIWACSILPSHCHMVIARHPRLSIESISGQLKAAATRELITENLHPFAGQPYKDGTLPTPWTRRKWDVFLDDDRGIRRAIEYVKTNPIKEGKRAQDWQLITPYRA